jgi:putative copper resistance protein D
LEPAVVLARLAAFVAAAALFGGPLFVLYGGRQDEAAPPGLRPVLIGAALAALLAADVALIAQTAQMAGDMRAGLDAATLHEVLTGSGFGRSIVARAAAGFAALVVLLRMRPGRRVWTLTAALGGVGLAALAWDGHGAADPGLAGALHAAADVIHLLAVGVWLGALLCLSLRLSARAPSDEALSALHRALGGFSGVGSAAVAAILASGLVNVWFLVGPHHLAGLVTTAWGWLLLAKLALFGAMLGLAARNRWRLTPRLEASLAGDPRAALVALRRSVGLETALGLGVLALVSVLGVLAPPASS